MTDPADVAKGERLPPVSHARDCDYVTSDGPAACTCDFYEREQVAVAALVAHLTQEPHHDG